MSYYLENMSREELEALSPYEKWEINCRGIADDGAEADAAFLLGGKPEFARERALAAAGLYHQNRVKLIVVSGGVEHTVEGRSLTEADYMMEVLRSCGVPEEVMIPEQEARTTRENMIAGMLQLNRLTRLNGIRKVTVVTSFWHMRRSLMLAELFLPQIMEIHPYPSFPEGMKSLAEKEQWLSCEENCARQDKCVQQLKSLVDQGLARDGKE